MFDNLHARELYRFTLLSFKLAYSWSQVLEKGLSLSLLKVLDNSN